MKRRADSRHISILHRLRNRAKEEKLPPNTVLPYYGMESFLRRLSKSKYREQLILKGALIFNAFNIPLRRSTRDIDFHGYLDNGVDTLANIVKEICEVPADDGVEFDTNSMRSEQIMLDANYEGVRIKLVGYLGKSKINLQLDFSFVDVITPGEKELEYPTLLDTAPFKVFGYPLETVIAEKLETMVRRSEFNSRRKDFYDLWLLSKMRGFDGSLLLRAIKETFQNRKTGIPGGLITALSDDFAKRYQTEWTAFLRREGLAGPGLDNFEAIVGDLKLFLLPPLEAANNRDPFSAVWEPGGPWTSL
jgi:predicted nucleotidyltransferase component of viral defense system